MVELNKKKRTFEIKLARSISNYEKLSEKTTESKFFFLIQLVICLRMPFVVCSPYSLLDPRTYPLFPFLPPPVHSLIDEAEKKRLQEVLELFEGETKNLSLVLQATEEDVVRHTAMLATIETEQLAITEWAERRKDEIHRVMYVFGWRVQGTFYVLSFSFFNFWFYPSFFSVSFLHAIPPTGLSATMKLPR